MKRPLTPKQMNLLKVIKARISETGVAPSIKEMMGLIGARSGASVFSLLLALEEKGYVVRKPGSARSVIVCADEDSTIALSESNARHLRDYAAVHGIGISTAANELLREMLECR